MRKRYRLTELRNIDDFVDIKIERDYEEKDKDKWLLLNKKFSAIWPNIVKKKDPMIDHEKFKEEKDKHSKYFSESPGK